MTEHACSESPNPRNAGFCSCGKRVDQMSAQHYRWRSLEREREFMREAARGVADPERMINHREARAVSQANEYVDDSMHVNLAIDRVRGCREELVDGASECVWWLEDNVEHPDAGEVFKALRHLILAYDLLSRVEA